MSSAALGNLAVSVAATSSSISCCRPWRTSSGISSPALRPASSGAKEEAPESLLGMILLVEVALKPGSRACSPFSSAGARGGGQLRKPPQLKGRRISDQLRRNWYGFIQEALFDGLWPLQRCAHGAQRAGSLYIIVSRLRLIFRNPLKSPLGRALQDADFHKVDNRRVPP